MGAAAGRRHADAAQHVSLAPCGDASFPSFLGRDSARARARALPDGAFLAGEDLDFARDSRALEK